MNCDISGNFASFSTDQHFRTKI